MSKPLITRANQALATLAKAMGVPELVLNANHEAALDTEYEGEKLQVSFSLSPSTEVLTLVSEIGIMTGDPEVDEAMLPLLAAGNIDPERCGGATVVPMPLSGVIYLCYHIFGPDFPDSYVKTAFLRFVDLSVGWRKQVVIVAQQLQTAKRNGTLP